MTPKEFDSEISRLNTAFNGYYNSERVKSLWPVLNHLPHETLRRYVNRVIWADKPPKLSEFLALINSLVTNNKIPQAWPTAESQRSLNEILSENPELKEQYTKLRRNLGLRVVP